MLLGLIFAVVGAAILWFGIYQKRRVRDMAAWPQVTGAICSAGVEETRSNDDDGGCQVDFTPRVEYQYVVNGMTHLGRRIALNARSYNSPRRAEAELAAYPPGAPVAVFYNPKKPGDAVLVRRAPGSNVLLFLGAVLLAVAIGVLIREVLA